MGGVEGVGGVITVQYSSRLHIPSPANSVWEADMAGLGLRVVIKYAIGKILVIYTQKSSTSVVYTFLYKIRELYDCCCVT